MGMNITAHARNSAGLAWGELPQLPCITSINITLIVLIISIISIIRIIIIIIIIIISSSGSSSSSSSSLTDVISRSLPAGSRGRRRRPPCTPGSVARCFVVICYVCLCLYVY